MIHVSSSAFLGKERENVLDCLAKNRTTQGDYVRRFEEAWASFCGVAHAIACSSGTSALHLAMQALGVQKGTAVFVPALTYVATANAVTYCGGTPIICDVDPSTWNLDPLDVERAIGEAKLAGLKPVGIVPVHLYGVPAAMAWLQELGLQHNLWVVEDAAQAHGTALQGRRAGSLGTAAAFSFYGSKVLSCGEGGVVTTNSSEVDRLARLYRGQGMSQRSPSDRYFHSVVGYNYRMTDLQAAIALAQVESYGTHATLRRQVIGWYDELLNGVGVQRQVIPAHSNPSNWLVTVLLPEGVDRGEVSRRMLASGVETRPTFIPLGDLPPYKASVRQTPVAAMLSARGLSLPTHANLTRHEVIDVVMALLDALQGVPA